MMLDSLRDLIGNASGATAIEYGFLAAILGLGILAALQILFNDGVSGLYGMLVTQTAIAFGS